MIESLTPEQIARFPFYVEKWLKHGLSTETNRAKAEEVIDRVYAAGGLPGPQFKIWMRSPFEGAVAALLLSLEKILRKSLAGPELRTQVLDEIRDEVQDEVWTQARDQVEDQVKIPVWTQVRTQVQAQVRTQVQAQVQDQVWTQVRTQVWAQPLICGYGSHDSGFLSFYDFFHSEGIVSGLDPVVPVMELATSAGWFWPFSGLVILTDNPVEIHMSQKKLHRDGGPAVRYADDFCVYSLNGVRVSKEIAETPASELSSQLVLSEKNAEVRREIVRKIGMTRICQDLGAKVIDRWKDYELLELDLGDGRRRPFVKMKNPSIDTIHIEGVPPEIQTVKQALAWRNGMKSFKEPEILT